jgi:hypothetical protein
MLLMEKCHAWRPQSIYNQRSARKALVEPYSLFQGHRVFAKIFFVLIQNPATKKHIGFLVLKNIVYFFQNFFGFVPVILM